MNDKDGMSGAETPVHQPPGRRVVAVVSAKGGVGASVVATNLAVLSAAESTRPVLVVDLCGERGAVARLLGVEPHLRWITVGADHGGPTTLLDSVSIGPGGVRLATAMFDDEAPPATSARHVRSLCHTLRVLFDVVIIDVPRTADALLPTVLAGADDVLIVSSMSSLGAHATRRLIGVINSAGTVQGQRTVVLNRTEANNDLDRAEVEDIIGVGAAVQLPYDAALIATSVNAGTPFVLMETQAQATRRIRDLAAALRIIDPLPETAPAGVDDAEIEVSGELAWRHHLGNVSRR